MLIAIPSEAFAKGKKKTSTRNLITKIDVKGNSITVNKKIYVMRRDVMITLGGEKAKFEDLKVGMRVSLSARIKTFGNKREKKANIYEVRRVSAHPIKLPKPERKKR
ncbi:MAG: hypothetical protein AB8F34_13820 [Akkermansiaceae bacterium]